jgi:hypothetical protein
MKILAFLGIGMNSRTGIYISICQESDGLDQIWIVTPPDVAGRPVSIFEVESALGSDPLRRLTGN